MGWCEANRVDYLLGLARARLDTAIAADLEQAREESATTGKPARRLRDVIWCMLDSCSRERRVRGKAEWTGDKADPRCVVTSLKAAAAAAQLPHEATDCARGEMQNRKGVPTLLKIGALVRVSVRRVKLAMASACPWRYEVELAHARLRPAATG